MLQLNGNDTKLPTEVDNDACRVTRVQERDIIRNVSLVRHCVDFAPEYENCQIRTKVHSEFVGHACEAARSR